MFSTLNGSFGFGHRYFIINDPTQLPSIQVWYDATNGSTTNFNTTLASGDDIGQWKDKSGTGHNANQSGNASKKPNWYSNVQNGNGAARFNGTSESLNVNPTAFLTPGGVGLTYYNLWVVAKASSLGGAGVIRPITCSDTDGMKIYHDGTHWCVKASGAVGTSTNTGDTNWHLFGINYRGIGSTNGDKVKLTIDGAEQSLTFTGTAASTTSASTTTFYIGQDNDATAHFFNGDIGEIIMITDQIGSTQIEAVESFLMKRWGIVP